MNTKTINGMIMNANDLFRSVYMRDVKPVSIKCKMALSDEGLGKF